MFERVRAIPYVTDGAHTGAELMAVGRGDSVAKAGFLGAGFRALGYPVRKVRWLLPALPPAGGSRPAVLPRECW